MLELGVGDLLRCRVQCPQGAQDQQMGLGFTLYRGAEVVGILLEVGGGAGLCLVAFPVTNGQEGQQAQGDASGQD